MSLIPARFVGFFPPQTSSEEIAHSFLINGAENTHQNEIHDLVHKLFNSSEKKGHAVKEDCQPNVSALSKKIFLCNSENILQLQIAIEVLQMY